MVDKGYLLGLMIHNGFFIGLIYCRYLQFKDIKESPLRVAGSIPNLFKPREIARCGRLVRTQVVSISIFREVMIVG